MHERTREGLDRLPAEDRAAVAAALERFRTPEHRAKEQAAREAYDREMRETSTIATAVDDSGALKELAATMRQHRERSGLTIEEVSSRSGIGRDALSELENGQVDDPTVGTLDRYARAIGARLRIGFESIGAG